LAWVKFPNKLFRISKKGTDQETSLKYKQCIFGKFFLAS
jgi:hypothetical protein